MQATHLRRSEAEVAHVAKFSTMTTARINTTLRANLRARIPGQAMQVDSPSLQQQ